MRNALGVAAVSAVVFVVAYAMRGSDLIGDYENGGVRDWATTVLLYGAALGLVAAFITVGVVALRRTANTVRSGWRDR